MLLIVGDNVLSVSPKSNNHFGGWKLGFVGFFTKKKNCFSTISTTKHPTNTLKTPRNQPYQPNELKKDLYH